MILPDPAIDRIVKPSAQHAGMTQIVRDGRCFQVAAVGSAAIAMLELHAECIATGAAVPDYGRRWPVENPQ